MSRVAPQFENKTHIPRSLLVSATYDGPAKSAVLKFYEPESQKIILWKDTTGHKPYCYTDLTPDEVEIKLGNRPDIIDISPTTLQDLAKDAPVVMTKITAEDPLAIGGTSSSKSIRNMINTWESDIKYYENYLYDNNLIVGKYYSVQDSRIHSQDEKISKEVQMALKSLLWDNISDEEMVDSKQFQEFIAEWANLLNQPIPPIRRLAVDIEVEAEEGRIPDTRIAEKKVTAVGFDGTGGFDDTINKGRFSKVFVLDTGAEKGKNELGPDVDVVFYDDEKKMLQDAFDVIEDFPFLLTYNGDDFDLPYLYYRAKRLGIADDDNPLYMMTNAATLKKGVHLDLYRTMSNRSFQIYVFSGKYTTFSLNEVSKAVINEKKIDYGKNLNELTLYETANYCWNDARITLKLTTFNSNLLMKLLIIISRIGRMPVDDIARLGVSQWIKSLLYYEHRKMNALIPQQNQLQLRSKDVASDAVIKDKKYRGGLVIEPTEGVHFSVVVMDFASLYPSIIKVKNLSYETVRCAHQECRENTIPKTKHWVCRKKNGITALIIGSLRELRVNYYKALSKSPDISEQDQKRYHVITQALKVILNASYGVMGAQIFPLYFLPAAEATTAVGRYTIQETAKLCENAKIKVLYGDSVVGDTPVVTSYNNGTVKIIPIKKLFNSTIRQGTRIWTDNGFQEIKHVYRHKVQKRIYDILTDTGFVQCTEDHSLVINNIETKPTELKIGDTVNQFPLDITHRHSIKISKEAAYWCGFILARILESDTVECGQQTQSVLIYGNSSRLQSYNTAYNIIVQNCGANVCRAFRDGMAHYQKNPDSHICIKHDRQHILQCITTILGMSKINYTLNADDKHITLSLKESLTPHTIKKITTYDTDEYVYDIETANHHFCGGVGNILLHNTDSLFLKNPSKDQIKFVTDMAKTNHGVDLEVDKEYRYCVLSNRKKNYFGVSKEGWVDVKGMTGKKSHTPQFIKTLFSDIIEVLSSVQDKNQFEMAREKISKKIAESAKLLEDKKIPIKDLAFNIMLSKDLSEYKKTIPQHVRAAKLMENGEDIKRGTIISYVKTNNRMGVKPISLARPDDIDSQKYLEFMESTLDQVMAPLNMDFEDTLGKPKQTGLDQFFWS